MERDEENKKKGGEKDDRLKDATKDGEKNKGKEDRGKKDG